ncbi:hypothetical protein D9M69_523270 [compost metagenome]
MLFGKGDDFGGGLDWAVAAGNQWRADTQRNAACLDLVAKRFDDMRVRADPDEAGIDDGAGEFGPLRKKAVAGMDGIGAGALGDVDQLGDIEIGLGRAAAREPIGFVGQLDEKRVHVRLGIDRDRLQTVVATGPNDAHCNLAAIGNQDFLHGCLLTNFWAAGLQSQARVGRTSANVVTGRKRIWALTGICPARSRWYSATVPMTG